MGNIEHVIQPLRINYNIIRDVYVMQDVGKLNIIILYAHCIMLIWLNG